MERKLAAIFSTDVKGYSRLMGADEAATIRTLTAYRTLMATFIQQYRGRVVDSPGDNLLAEFPSVAEAVECAVAIQRELRVRNAALPLDRRMEFRIGINLGDVIAEGERIYGDGVNIAARLEGLAEAGDLCISGTVYDQIKTRLALGYEDLGLQAVKNIAEPVRVYRVQLEPGAAALTVREQGERAVGEAGRPLPQKGDAARRGLAWPWQKGALTLGGLLRLLARGVTVWQRSVPPSSPSQVVPAEKAPTVALPNTPSIVVLPFINLSSDPEQEYFSDGITEDLTSKLSNLAGLAVISRSTAFTYKGKTAKVQEVSKELGVRYVLEGSVRKAGAQVRITAQLIDAATDQHLWAERYDHPLQGLFALQDALVHKIVTTLQLQLTVRERGYLVHKTENVEAYDVFLRGTKYFTRVTQENNVQARQLFEHAVALDPTYAEAYAFLAGTYRVEWNNRWSQDPQVLERAFELAQQALALDDTQSTAYMVLGWSYWEKLQYEPALAAIERGIAREPSNAHNYAVQGEILRSMGRPEEALRSLEKAMRLNPRYPGWYLGTLAEAYIMTGRYAEAIPALNTRLLRAPHAQGNYLALAEAYRQQWAAQLSQDPQTLAQALAAAQRTVESAQRVIVLREDAFSNQRALGYVYLWQQQYEQALAAMELAVALEPDALRGSAAFDYAGLAEVLSRMGRKEEALGAAEQALRLQPAIVDAHLASVGTAYAAAGRPEQALAPLQRFVSRYPNVLQGHLTLAAVHSELGRKAAARAETAEVLRLNPHFSLEVYRQREPFKDPAQLARQLAALRRAGLR